MGGTQNKSVKREGSQASESTEWVLLSKYCTRKITQEIISGSWVPSCPIPVALDLSPIPCPLSSSLMSSLNSSESVVMLTYSVASPQSLQEFSGTSPFESFWLSVRRLRLGSLSSGYKRASGVQKQAEGWTATYHLYMQPHEMPQGRQKGWFEESILLSLQISLALLLNEGQHSLLSLTYQTSLQYHLHLSRIYVM